MYLLKKFLNYLFTYILKFQYTFYIENHDSIICLLFPMYCYPSKKVNKRKYFFSLICLFLCKNTILCIWLRFSTIQNCLTQVRNFFVNCHFPSFSTYRNHVFWLKFENISECRTLPGLKWVWLNSAHFKLYYGTKDIVLQGVTKCFHNV